VAAFNLFWFGLQLVFSAATRTDDWAWPMQQFHAVGPVRYGMIALGICSYVLTVRVVGDLLVPFGQSVARVRTIAVTGWVAAGAIAILTAALDSHASNAILRDAVAQSLALPIGLLLAPARAARSLLPKGASNYLGVSIPWIVTAAIVGGLSVAFLGHGFAITI
jgi:hypothetical protein